MPFLSPGDAARSASLLRTAFAQRFGLEADVVARAPGRVNLIGEHTDYNGGLVLPLALPHATLAVLRLREDDVVRCASTDVDEPWSGRLDDLAPGGERPGWVGYAAGVAWALGTPRGFDLLVDSTVPSGAGLSSSAALECAVGTALLAATGAPLDDPARRSLARAAIRAETEVVGAPTGGMDQTVAMLAEAGSALLVDFEADEPSATSVPLPADGWVWLVTDTRVSHALVDGGYAARRADCEAAAAALDVPSLRRAEIDAVEALPDERVRRRARHVVTEIARVEDAVAALAAGDLDAFGALMDASHASMRDDFEISCAELDAAVDAARGTGAIGARMTGGGFGGSSVALVPAERAEGVAAAIDARFAADGFAPPQHLRAVASAGAQVL
ncbi:galactokinase [Nocardioides sp. TRM66260-LWL]|uniref:galactokinase n=1 Tax=Nocardioides sp. TRM66260-LWL TaxID=2874478 RepID=UPI001CC6E3A9|nr:galactokinase [Nocardioides sp. TRM66260-LWL]MBZ5733945.1 galactokinase [Nocardioides sp. TRM66260-LWL]